MTALLLRLALGGFNLLKLIGAAMRRFFSALDVQGWIGLVLVTFLAFMWVNAAGEARHWKKQSGQFEKLYTAEKSAFDQTMANLRAAAVVAQQKDAANAVRVKSEQAAISERSDHDYHTRITDARAYAERLRNASAADSGVRTDASVPVIPAAASGPHQAAGKDGLSLDDRLTATDQAIQLDELIKWVTRQHQVDPNGHG